MKRLVAALWILLILNALGQSSASAAQPGIDWISETSAADNAWVSVTYGNGLFVGVSRSGAGNRVMTSPDGIRWTSRTSAADNSWTWVTYGNGLFVAVSEDGVGNRVMTSPDGITWTSRTSAADNQWYGVTYGNGLFVAVSSDGSPSQVMISPVPAPAPSAVPALSEWSQMLLGLMTIMLVGWHFHRERSY